MLFRSTTQNSGISANFVRSVTIDRYDHAWICTNLGLNYFDGTSWMVYDMSTTRLPVDNIAVITIENDSLRWIGTINGGFVKMEDTAFTVYNIPIANFPDNTITGIVIDSSNIKWSACPAGALVRFYNGSIFAYNAGSSLIPSNSLTTLVIDSLQNFYIGSYDKGLIKKSGNIFAHWDTQNSGMTDDLIYAVAVERNGVIWCGTETHGVVRFDENMLTAVGDINKNVQFDLWPNPGNDQAALHFKSNADRKIKVIDLIGNCVLEKMSTTAELFLDYTGLNSGL